MKYNAKLAIDANHIEFCDSLLADAEYRYDTEELPCVFTVRFDNGYEADIKVVNADPPYIDAVLFDEYGFEISILEPEFEQILGTYTFNILNDTFIVELTGYETCKNI